MERISGVQFSASKDERAQQAEEGEVSELTLEASLRKAVALLSEGEEKRTTTLRTRCATHTHTPRTHHTLGCDTQVHHAHNKTRMQSHAPLARDTHLIAVLLTPHC